MELNLLFERLIMPLYSFLGYVGFHAFISRTWIREGTVKGVLVAYVFGLSFWAFLELMNPIYGEFQVLGRVIYFFEWLAYSCLTFYYFAFVNFGESSLRLRFMREVRDAKGQMPEADILNRYSAQDIGSVRLERLSGSGEIMESRGRYFLGKARMLWLSRIFGFLKSLYGIGRELGHS